MRRRLTIGGLCVVLLGGLITSVVVSAQPFRVSSANCYGSCPTPHRGFYLASANGGVFKFGVAKFHGSLGQGKRHRKLAAPIVGISSTPYGRGYILVSSDGGVFNFGNAQFKGSIPKYRKTHPHFRLKSPIVGAASTGPTGYLLIGADGGVFKYGSAHYFGSVGGQLRGRKLRAPIVAILNDPAHPGYWAVGADGGVYTFGAAKFHGSVPGVLKGRKLQGKIVGGAATPDGRGYWLVASDGGVFGFGDAHFYGGLPTYVHFSALTLNAASSTYTGSGYVIGIASTPDGKGYWVALSGGHVYSFGDADHLLQLQKNPYSPMVGITPEIPIS